MGELSVTIQTADEKIKWSEETKKNKGKTKMDVTTKSVKFVEPEPINKPSNGQKYPSRVFVSSQRKYINGLQKLKREIYETIQNTEGVWCTEIMAHYFKRYGYSPDLIDFRFCNILQLIDSMRDRLVITRVEDYKNMWVCDANAPHPPPQKKEPEPEPEPEPVEEIPWWDPCPPEPPDRSAIEEDALPGVPFASDVFPKDCIQPGETIPNMELPVLDSDFLDLNVFITGFYSPSHIWLRITGNYFNAAIEELIDDMIEYYEHGDGVPRRLAYAAMKVGLYCAARHEIWHRALIVRIVDFEHAKVLLVDQGMVLKLSIDDMKPLRREWTMTPPAQAIRARMVGVRPPDGAQLWPRFSCSQFVDQARGHALIARILYVDEAERVINVHLRNPSTKQRIKRKLVITEGIDHGTELIKSGYAEPEPRSLTETGERFSYFYPQFDVLESGATPSFQELDVLSKQGFEPEDVPSFIKHVPPLEPIRCPTPPHLTADIEDFDAIDASTSSDLATSVAVTSGPVTSDPATLGSVTSGPVTSDPVSLGTVTSGPLTSDPATLGSLTSGFVTSNLVIVVTNLGTVTRRRVTKATALGPVTSSLVTGATTSGPVTSRLVTGSTTSGPVLSEPVTSRPVTSDPVTSRPVTSDPVTLNPETSASAKFIGSVIVGRRKRRSRNRRDKV